MTDDPKMAKIPAELDVTETENTNKSDIAMNVGRNTVKDIDDKLISTTY